MIVPDLGNLADQRRSQTGPGWCELRHCGL